MNDTVIVAPVDCAYELKDVHTHELWREPAGVFLEHLQKVTIGVLEDKVELAFSPERFLEKHDVKVLQHPQYLDFSQSRLAHHCIVFALLEFLDRDDLFRVLVPAVKGGVTVQLDWNV